MNELEISLFENTLVWWAFVLIVMAVPIGILCVILYNKYKKPYDRANAIMKCGFITYYIDNYEYKDDYIEAVDIYGKKVILPKEHTVIKEK